MGQTSRGVGRRGFIAGGTAILGGGVGGKRQLRPAQADEFVASVGLCVHLASAPYAGMFNEVLRRAQNLGVRHFRDDLRPTDDLRRWRALFREAGIRAHLLVSPATNTPVDMIAYARALGPEIVSAIEGQNEGDGDWFRSQPSARGGWAKSVIEYQKAIFGAVRANFPVETLPVLSPTVLDYQPGDMMALREAAPYCDIVALHAYIQEQQHPETSDPYAALDWYLREMRDPFKPGAPVMITETGYRTGPSGISPRAAAIYLPRLLLNAFDQGIQRSFLYEMFDEGRNRRDGEQNYGLLRSDGTAKPAYEALRTLLLAFSDPGPRFVPGSLTLEIRGAPPDLRCRAYAKRNGERWLAIWRAAPVWAKAGRRDLPLWPARIGLVFDRPPGLALSRPIWPEAPWAKLAAPSETTVFIDQRVTLVRLIP